MRAAALALALAACADAADPCAPMCDAAAALYGACLDDAGLGWDAVGYADEAAYLDACATWAWELRVLERDAVKRGELDAPGAVDATCEAREVALTAPDADCATYDAMDWSTAPW